MKKHHKIVIKLAEEMKIRREGKKLTLAQVAKLARVSRSTVQRIESGDDAVSLATFLSYASALELGDKVIKSMLEAVCRVPVRSGQSEGTRARINLLEEMKVS